MKFESLRKANLLIDSIKTSMELNMINSSNEYKLDSYLSNIPQCSTLSINKNVKTNRIDENDFTRVICLSGKIKIRIPSLNEEVLVTSLNTQLITPNTPYIIESLEDSEILFIQKEKKNGSGYQIVERKTIYNYK